MRDARVNERQLRALRAIESAGWAHRGTLRDAVGARAGNTITSLWQRRLIDLSWKNGVLGYVLTAAGRAVLRTAAPAGDGR